MVVCLVSRYIGNSVFRSEGIYDEILKIRNIPFLEEEPPKVTKRLVLRAKDLMSTELVMLQLTMQVNDILEILQEYDHLDFPVTDSSKGGQLVGSISRATLKAVLWKMVQLRGDGDVEGEESPANPKDIADLSYDQFGFDRLQEVSDTELSNQFRGEDRFEFMSLAKYVTLSPIAFDEDGSAERAFELFRTLGLRQLVVVDNDKIPIGVVTRFDLKVLEDEDNNHDNATDLSANIEETDATSRSASLISIS